MTRRFVFGSALLALLAILGFGADRLAAAELQTLEIATSKGVHVFSVEVADNDDDRARGLMFRRELPQEHGMLFDFKRNEPVAMWMRNTYIALDMIFIRSDGRIQRIAENTEPFSEHIIPSGGPVRAVLEVAAGTVKKLGIMVGDRIGHPIFSIH